MSEPRQIGILMCGDMVRAILDGRKTQTRRVVEPQPVWDYDNWAWAKHNGPEYEWPQHCPYQPGDLLWVRETWYCDDFTAGDMALARNLAPGYSEGRIKEMWHGETYYRADPNACDGFEAGCPCEDDDGQPGWQLPDTMPKWAARLWLRVKSVRVERVQDISREDAVAEGHPCRGLGPEIDGDAARDWFVGLWESINKKRGFGWGVNPWVWRIEYERAGAP